MAESKNQKPWIQKPEENPDRRGQCIFSKPSQLY